MYSRDRGRSGTYIMQCPHLSSSSIPSDVNQPSIGIGLNRHTKAIQGAGEFIAYCLDIRLPKLGPGRPRAIWN